MTTDGPRLVLMDNRMNRDYDGCTDEYSLSQNLLMEKEIKFKTKILLALFSHTQKILNFKCHTIEQRSTKYNNRTLKPRLKCLCLYIIVY